MGESEDSSTSAERGRVEPASAEIVAGSKRFRRVSYQPPERNAHYAVRDKAAGERVIRIDDLFPERNTVRVETLDAGQPSNQFAEIKIDSLNRQAAKGWCHLLLPIAGDEKNIAPQPREPREEPNVALRLDSQNFGRCCGDIVRANIKFSTQLIKDVGDGPFRAGKYEQAFLTFEQLAVGFNAAVSNSRRAITDGRRKLTAEKGKLSGKEIQERSAAFTRSEHLIHTAEREFATILEGLRMYLRAHQNIQSANLTDPAL